MKHGISVLLAVILLAGVIIVPGVTASAEEIKTGTLVTFGSYPQTSVVDPGTLAKLNAQSLSWTYYDYYCDGKQENYMKYADVTLSGERYRAVTFTHYRPLYWSDSDSYTYQDDNGYEPDKVYWFRYDPIVWRVLDAKEGLLMAENLIDSQPFHNVHYENNGYWYGDQSCTYYVSDWAYSSLRSWMNDDFYDTAFSAEKSFIKTTSLTTPSSYSSEYDADPTKDKGFLLSRADVLEPSYGFSSDSGYGEDTNRIAYGTDYARCQGLIVDGSTDDFYSGASDWHLRTPCTDDGTGSVNSDCFVHSGVYGTQGIVEGIRPALRVDLQSAISKGIIKITDRNNLVINGAAGADSYEDITCSQEHVVSKYMKKNDLYEKTYFGGAAAALDGSGSLTDFVIPGLSKKDNMVPQGIAYDADTDRLLISAYYAYGEKETVKTVPSRVFALDMSTGKFAAQFDLYNDDGSAFTGHVGGIAVSDNNLYMSYGSGVVCFPLDDLKIPEGKSKKLTITKENRIKFSTLNGVGASYLSVSGDTLYTGNFYKKNSKEYGAKWSEDNPSVVIAFKLSGSDSAEEWTALKSSAAKTSADITYKLPDSVSQIQGAAVNGGMLYLTASYGRTNESSLFVFDVSSGKLNQKMKLSKKGISMLEDLEVINGQLYTLAESGAYKYHLKEKSNVSITPTDVVWRIDPNRLLGIKPTAKDPENKTEKFEIKEVSGKMSVTFRQDWFSGDSEAYNHELGIFCSQFATLGYDDTKQNLRRALADIGMDPDKIIINGNAGEDHVNYFIANRKINADGEEYTLIFMGLIGSYAKQWYSNFTPGDGEIHEGFLNAKKFAKKQLDKYISDNLGGVDKQHVKILITGHSRGAAASNLLAADLINSEQYCQKENVFAYCFATPNSNRNAEETGRSDYKRIFNVVNPEDFVTKCLPFFWDYSRYGTTYVLPSKTNMDPSKYNKYLKTMRSEFGKLKEDKKYNPYGDGEDEVYSLIMKIWNNVSDVDEFQRKDFDNGKYGLCSLQEFFKQTLCAHLVGDKSAKSRLVYTAAGLSSTDNLLQEVAIFFLTNGFFSDCFEDSHCAETYCAYMITIPEREIKYRKGLKGTVNCPVDVDIYLAATGELVGRISGNAVDEEISAGESAVVMTVKGDEKSFWLPDENDYEVRLTGTDDGAMDYTLSYISGDTGELERVCFEDVPLTDGVVYSYEIGEDINLGETELIDSDGDFIEPAIHLAADDDRTCKVTVTAEEGGRATESLTALIGDYVTLEVAPEDGYLFDGWYDSNDKCLSADSEYRFEILEDVLLTAKFTPDTETHVWDEGVVTEAPSCIVPGVKTYTCADCGKVKTEFLPVDPDNHFAEPELVNAKDATETEDGYTGDKVCSACGVVIEKGVVIPKILKSYAPGDVDGDGQVLAKDARLALRASASLEKLEGAAFKAADVDGNDKILANDARQILRFSAQLIKEFEKADK